MSIRATLLLTAVFAVPAHAAGGVFDLTLTQLQPGIYVLQRPDFLRQPVEPNALVIVNDADVVVVDPGGVPASAEHAIALIRSVTNKPVSVLVNTHWHGDHVLGNQVYRREFPGVRIVSHVNTYRDITGKPMAYIGRQDKVFSEIVADWEAQQAKGTLEPRFQKMLPDVREAMLENRRVTLTPPDLTFTDELVLHRGEREIHIRYLGRGNTEGDAVVWLPKERVLESGDLVVGPIPYGFGSYPKEWIETLDKLAAYDFKVLVPGHGEIQKNRDQIRYIQDLLREVRTQVAAAVKDGKDLAATRKAVDLSKLAQRVTGNDPGKQRLFDAWWTAPITRSAWLQERGEPIVQGASDETG